jgi:hypothetical protein
MTCTFSKLVSWHGERGSNSARNENDGSTFECR